MTSGLYTDDCSAQQLFTTLHQRSNSLLDDDDDDEEFARRVLRLAPGETEDAFHTKVTEEARRYGLDVAQILTRHTESAQPELMNSPERSLSTDSQQTTASSLITFDLSKPSRRTWDNTPSTPSYRRGSEAYSMKDHDSILSTVRPTAARPPTAYEQQETMSEPASTQPLTDVSAPSGKKTSRLGFMKGLSKLRSHRRTLSGGPIKNQSSQCVYEIFEIPYVPDVSSMKSDSDIVRSSADIMSQVRPRRPQQRYKALCNESTLLASQESRMNLAKALDMPDFRTLRENQVQQRDRCLVWEERCKDRVRAVFAQRTQEVREQSAEERDLLEEKHTIQLAEVEDKHVVEEAALRETHEAEKRNADTALKHMQAYCSRVSATGRPHNRPVTDQDRLELAKAVNARNGMDAKHQSAINVLRGEQSRRLKIRAQKQAEELDQFDLCTEKEIAQLECECVCRLNERIERFERKRKSLDIWWSLEVEIWRKILEQETGVFFDGELPAIAWDEKVESERIFDEDVSTSLQDRPTSMTVLSTWI